MGRKGKIRVLLLSLVVAGCGSAAASDDPEIVRLGYFPNLTHAPALVGLADGLFAEELGERTLEGVTFNAGTEAVEALFSGALDLAFVGPNPAINAHAQSDGEAIRIIAGSTSGGAALVVQAGIDQSADLLGKRIATPALGNTQDVALRAWLDAEGLETDLEGGGKVAVIPQSNAQTLETFRSGDIDGAWVPEPWATRLVLEGHGKVLIDERDLWPDGQFVTTHLIVRTEYLDTNAEAVAAVLRGLIRAVDAVNADPSSSQATVNESIESLTGSALSTEIIQAAWQNLSFTLDPIASSLRKSADDAIAVGLLDPVNLTQIYALGPLNEILIDLGREEVRS